MSLRIAGSIANAALRANEVGLSVASANVANVDTEGYTRKTATVAARGTGNGVSSVDVTGIGSTIDLQLMKTLVAARTGLGAAQTTGEWLDRLQSSLGTVDSGTGTAAMIDTLANALATFATSPESGSAKAVVVQDLANVAASLRSASATVQSMRDQVDNEIATTVEAVNRNLDTIADLNDRIVKAKALGKDTADLEDRRNLALQDLAGHLDIRYQTDANGQVRIATASGTALLDSSVHRLSYTPAASVGPGTTFSPITVDGKDATAAIRSGTLGALITLRDETLPAQQASLDTLALALKDTLNDIHNRGTAVPAPQTLTGTRTVTAGDALSASGTLRVAVTGANGTAVSVQDFDLSGFATVQDAIDALDAVPGLSASLSADGKLVLTADDAANGVALAGIDDAVGPGGKGFSAWFGMNDLLAGSGAGDLNVSAAIAADSSRLAAGTLSTDAGLTAGSTALARGDATIAQALSAAFSGTVDFPAAGGLPARTTGFAGYAGAIVQGIATAAAGAASSLEAQSAYTDGLAGRLASQSGVNLNEELAAIQSLQTAYQAAAAVMQAVRDMFDTALGTVR
ncbi:flagellar hook-associated protein FlgK [Azospirillum halopraeferens]|uniref:flagellar hook-associated protein FlgK n=1 Tax=Azospirillum halopraeferens TaxID=34010 RepID=UPI0004214EFF|nr:flagellar hook-associated protein FlgK [Azospirillum halopraeferens]